MIKASPVKVLIAFTLAVSLSSVQGHALGDFRLPIVPLGRAVSAPAEGWYPAGPAMDTVLVTIFQDQYSEWRNMKSNWATNGEDLMDQPLIQQQLSDFSSQDYYVTSGAHAQGGFSEIEFNLANNFWGCDFNFGNSPCGTEIRQGIAHLIDKASFVTNEPTAYGSSAAIDNPLAVDNAGLPNPNPCSWDQSFVQTGQGCAVGAPAGIAYHLSNAAGANGFKWLPAPGSLDLNAAAQHFVNAGIANSFNPSQSTLKGISSSAAGNVPDLLVRVDSPGLLDLGNSLAEEICYMFTGSYSVPCAYLSIVRINVAAFPGLTTPTTAASRSWWMYTAGPSGYVGPDFVGEIAQHLGNGADCGTVNVCTPDPFDSTLYYIFNSRFTSVPSSNQAPGGACSNSSVPSRSAVNYMYLCSPTYDTLSSLMEYAPCVTAPGDPTPGQASPTYASCSGTAVTGNCTSTSQCSAFTAGYQAEDAFGKGAYSIPVIGAQGQQYVYLANTPGNSAATWQRVINNPASGPSNYFTWLNAYNPSPAQAGTIRQAVEPAGHTLNPYGASTPSDFAVLGNIYESLDATNPLAETQAFDWLTTAVYSKDNSGLAYTPPTGTVLSYRFTLRNDLYFQDGTRVSPFDVAFSYLTLKANGAYQSGGAAPMVGITILGQFQFDINLNQNSRFSLLSLTSIPILPARWWTNLGKSQWDIKTTGCQYSGSCYPAQYTLQASSSPGTPPQPICALACAIPASALSVISGMEKPTFDPILNHVLVGTGPWECGTVDPDSGSGSCSSNGFMNVPPGGSYTLSRFGKGQAPASGQPSGTYFRSSGNLALWIWSEQNDATPSTIFNSVAACYNKPVDLTGSCAHWQEGIGNPGSGSVVSSTQVGIENRFYGLNWIAPWNWVSTPPTGIGPPAPVLYEGGVVLKPANLAGCPSGYDC